jgi:hypothetical protein
MDQFYQTTYGQPQAKIQRLPIYGSALAIPHPALWILLFF